MPAKATGQVVPGADGLPRAVRVSVGKGRRVMVPWRPDLEPPGFDPHDPAQVEALALAISDEVRATQAVPVATPKTVNEWVETWLGAREARGLRSARQDRDRYAKWIAPRLGRLAMVDVTRRNIEELVEDLDNSVRAGKCAWKTAQNTWALVSKMWKDACQSKTLALRIRDTNPAREVQGPDRGVKKSGPYLWPSEYLAIMRCKHVPARWKRLITLAIYTYTRLGELKALDASSVHVDQGYVHVHQAIDHETGNLKPTKTGMTRKVPIERSLVPLLRRMRRGATGRLVERMPPSDVALRLREYCKKAGLTREDLYANDETRRQIDWHDLRHTGITWRAIRGDDPLKIQRAAGHSDLKTTMIYVNEAEIFDQVAFGEPFPPVPLAVFYPGEAETIEESSGTGLGSAFEVDTLPRETTANFRSSPRGSSPCAARPDGSPRVDSTSLSDANHANPSASADDGATSDDAASVPLAPSLDDLRARLDRAILAERWDAVTAIDSRIKWLEAKAGATSPAEASDEAPGAQIILFPKSGVGGP